MHRKGRVKRNANGNDCRRMDSRRLLLPSAPDLFDDQNRYPHHPCGNACGGAVGENSDRPEQPAYDRSENGNDACKQESYDCRPAVAALVDEPASRRQRQTGENGRPKRQPNFRIERDGKAARHRRKHDRYRQPQQGYERDGNDFAGLYRSLCHFRFIRFESDVQCRIDLIRATARRDSRVHNRTGVTVAKITIYCCELTILSGD